MGAGPGLNCANYRPEVSSSLPDTMVVTRALPLLKQNTVVTLVLAWVTAVETEFLHVWTISMGVVNWAMYRVVYL